MALINFTDLDFDQIKTSIKDYLRSNSTFTDFDYEGSNLSVLLDVLAYNTYITAPDIIVTGKHQWFLCYSESGGDTRRCRLVCGRNVS